MKTKLFRTCALWHEAFGIVQTKVIFREDGKENPEEVAYWMDRKTYDAIPLGVKAMPEDYMKYGKLNPAQNTDIYSVL